MSHIDVLCSRKHAIGSLLIRGWHRTPVSHVSVIDPAAGEVIEAIAFHGVRAHPLERARAEASYSVIRRIAVPDPDRGIAFARSQIDKGYDWKANVGIGFRTDWNDPAAWNCIELVAASIAAAGRELFHDRRAHRLWPGLLWLPDFS